MVLLLLMWWLLRPRELLLLLRELRVSSHCLRRSRPTAGETLCVTPLTYTQSDR